MGVFLLCLLVCASTAGAATLPNCHNPGDFDGSVDQQGARAAMRRGDALPFEKVLELARPQFKGEVVGQKLEQHQGTWLYELRVIDADGHMQYLHFGARSGRYIALGAGQCAS